MRKGPPTFWNQGNVGGDTDREKRASFDRQASATDSVSFLGLFPPKANKTVFFFVSFYQGATRSGILFLVSIERGTSRRVYHRRPWLSDMSQLGGAPCRFLARPGCGTRRCCRTDAHKALPSAGPSKLVSKSTASTGSIDCQRSPKWEDHFESTPLDGAVTEGLWRLRELLR